MTESVVPPGPPRFGLPAGTLARLAGILRYEAEVSVATQARLWAAALRQEDRRARMDESRSARRTEGGERRP